MSEEDEMERSRDDVLSDLRRVREEAAYKVYGEGRIRDTERASIRCQYLRVIVQAANAERRLLKDRDLDELRERVEALEADDSDGIDELVDRIGDAENIDVDDLAERLEDSDGVDVDDLVARLDADSGGIDGVSGR